MRESAIAEGSGQQLKQNTRLERILLRTVRVMSALLHAGGMTLTSTVLRAGSF